MVPEDVLRGPHGVPQLAYDGDARPQVDVLLPRPQDGGRGLVDPQPRGQGLHARGCRCLKLRLISELRVNSLQENVRKFLRLEHSVEIFNGYF